MYYVQRGWRNVGWRNAVGATRLSQRQLPQRGWRFGRANAANKAAVSRMTGINMPTDIERGNTVSDIAVIIPAYNCAHTIERALASVFSQSELPGEVIIVDDGSTDLTAGTIAESEYADKVKYVRQVNGGPSKARNHALSLASKSWVAFLDADDIWSSKDKLSQQIALLNAHPHAVLVDSYARVDWHGARVITINRRKNGSEFKRFLFSNVVNATSSVVARLDCIRQIGGFAEDLRFGEDRLLWAQLAKLGEIHTLPQVTVNKFNAPDNLTSQGGENYHYRLELVERLLNLADENTGDLADIWFANIQEFLRLSFKVNDPPAYLRIYQDAIRLVGTKLHFSQYGLLAVYAKLFGSFKPLPRG